MANLSLIAQLTPKTSHLYRCGVMDLLQFAICSFRAIVGVDLTIHMQKNNLHASKSVSNYATGNLLGLPTSVHKLEPKF